MTRSQHSLQEDMQPAFRSSSLDKLSLSIETKAVLKQISDRPGLIFVQNSFFIHTNR
jgi:hypothetical protein